MCDRYPTHGLFSSVGSHAINGVAALHTELLKRTVLRDFHRVSPEKFFNVTNGVTPREFERLEPLAGDLDFQRNWQAVKAENKRNLAGLIKERIVHPHSLFDIQVKRLQDYKRQHRTSCTWSLFTTGSDVPPAPRKHPERSSSAT